MLDIVLPLKITGVHYFWMGKVNVILNTSLHFKWQQYYTETPIAESKCTFISFPFCCKLTLGFTPTDVKFDADFKALTAHNWQKWKRVFLTCPCHKIYRDEAVGLKSCNILEKLRFLWKCEIWGNIVKNWYFVNNCLIEARISKFFCTRVTHIILIIWSTAHFVSV